MPEVSVISVCKLLRSRSYSHIVEKLRELSRLRKRKPLLAKGGVYKTMKSSPLFEKQVRPIFIIGAPRSGTSIMTWALGQHPNIQPMPETAWIASMAVGAVLSFEKGSERGRFSHLSNVEYPLEPFLQRVGESVDSIVHDVFEERCQQFYGDYRERGRVLKSTNKSNTRLQIRHAVDDPKLRWVDGTPLNTHYIWPLSVMFPDAVFVHNLRRPEGVALSLEGFDKVGANPMRTNEALKTWIHHAENGYLAELAFGSDRVFRLDFDRIGNDREPLMQELLTFLGESYFAECASAMENRINSSQTDESSSREFDRIKSQKLYQTANSTYEKIRSGKPEHTKADALEILKSSFIEQCDSKVLL